jgi:hypothetical protein
MSAVIDKVLDFACCRSAVHCAESFARTLRPVQPKFATRLD